MKNAIVFVGLGLAALSFAHAENRLFLTDILKQGGIDASLTIGHDTHSENLVYHGNPGTRKYDYTTESFQIRYGLGGNWHIGAELSNYSHGVQRTDYSNPALHYVSRNEGGQNPTLWATYGIIDDKTNPLSLTGQVLVRPDTTGRYSTYTARLNTGWKSSNTLKLFGSYSATVASDSNVGTENRLSVGAHKDLSENFALIPYADYRRLNATDIFSAQTQYVVGLRSNIQIVRNSYLIPDISHYRNSAADSKDGFFHQDAASNGTAVRLGLYHLF